MTFRTFLAKNNIFLPEPTRSLCLEGIHAMKQSRDVLHTEEHIYRLLDYLHLLLENKPEGNPTKIDMEVLLLAICWHDIWKAKRLARNYFFMFFDDIFEGIGSIRIFLRRAKKTKLSNNVIKQITYAIRKHTRFVIFLPKTVEARILRDIDHLDLFSMDKVEALKRQYLSDPAKINPRLLKLAKFYYDHFIGRITVSTFHFGWSKSEFTKKKKVLDEEVNKCIDKYSYLA